MGKMQRNKGAVKERELVNLFKENGINSMRVPMSGSLAKFGQTGSHDVDVFPLGRPAPLVCEVKARKEIPKMVKQWLGENDLLAMKGDREPWVFVVPEEIMLELLCR